MFFNFFFFVSLFMYLFNLQDSLNMSHGHKTSMVATVNTVKIDLIFNFCKTSIDYQIK